MALTLTKAAAAEFKRIMQDTDDLDESAVMLRLGVKGGGCSGFSYSLDLTQEKTDTDEEFESEGVKIVCDRGSLIHLDGTTVDFRDEMMGREFTFDNPNATSSCGCNKSFSV